VTALSPELGSKPETKTGYTDPTYAAALDHLGEPVMLPRSGGQVLLRTIAGTALRDAVGPYPFLACRD